MATATLTSKGQTTIPKAVRDHLGLRTGDRMEFVIQGDAVVLRALTRDVRELKGMLPKPKRPVPLATMERVVRERAGRR
jgi:antitoxin PrlF